MRRLTKATLAALAMLLATAPAASAQYGDDQGGGGEGGEAPAQAWTTGEVATAESDLGTIVVDAEGRTLYGFTPDQGGTPTCNGDCAANWPPLTTENGELPAAGDGIDAAKLTTAEREDGTTQVLYNNWPLYYYAQDTAAGDTNGQGVGEQWYVLDTAGALVKEAAAAGAGGELPFTGPGDALLPTGVALLLAGGLAVLVFRNKVTGRHVAAAGKRSR